MQIRFDSTYPDEAVMEMHPEKRSSQTGSIWDVFMNELHDELLGFRAGVIVESSLKLCLSGNHSKTAQNSNNTDQLYHRRSHDQSILLLLRHGIKLFMEYRVDYSICFR